MTATRERRSDPDTTDDDTSISWDERSVIKSRKGIPWWGAVLMSFGLAAIGAFANQILTGSLGAPFYACFAAGAVGAVLAAKRRNVFGPMVQPPLITAVIVPMAVLTASGLPQGSDLLAKALAVGTPLINSFPVMAGTTAVTVLLGILRFSRERNPHQPDEEAPQDDEKTRRVASSDLGVGSEAKQAGARPEARPPGKLGPTTPPPRQNRTTPPRDDAERPPRRRPDRPPEGEEPGPRQDDKGAGPPRSAPRGDDAPPSRRPGPQGGGRPARGGDPPPGDGRGGQGGKSGQARPRPPRKPRDGPA